MAVPTNAHDMKCRKLPNPRTKGIHRIGLDHNLLRTVSLASLPPNFVHEAIRTRRKTTPDTPRRPICLAFLRIGAGRLSGRGIRVGNASVCRDPGTRLNILLLGGAAGPRDSYASRADKYPLTAPCQVSQDSPPVAANFSGLREDGSRSEILGLGKRPTRHQAKRVERPGPKIGPL